MINSSIKKNFIMNSLLTMSSMIFPIITFPYVSRIISPVGTGKVSFAISLISYFNMIAQLGIPTYGIRSCAKVRDNKEELSRIVHELVAINLMTTLVSYIIFFAVLLTVPRLQEDRILYIVVSTTIIFQTIGIEWLYKALEQYTYITIRSVSFKLIALVFMFLFIHNQDDYIIYGIITVFASSASMVLNLINSKRYIYFKCVGDYKLRKHLKAIFVFFAIAFAASIYTNLDVLLLGFMKSDIDVGYYNAAIKVKSILVSIVTSLGVVLFPRVSYYIEHSYMELFENLTKKAINFVLVFSIPLSVYFSIFSQYIILFLGGKDFFGAIVPMRIIMFTLPVIGITNIFGMQILTPYGKEKIILISNIIGVFVDLFFNILLIPHLGASGAAIASFVAEMSVLIVEYSILRSVIRFSNMRIACWKILISIFIGSIIAWNANEMININNILGNILVTGSIYFSVTYILMILFKEEFLIYIINQVKIKKKL